MSNTLKPTSIANKINLGRKYILPYFGQKSINKITPADIRIWHGDLITKHGLSTGSIKTIHAQASSIFNYAVKFYNLAKNPCQIAGNVGKSNRSLKFWTASQFRIFVFCFLENCRDTPMRKFLYLTLFYTLFYTGIRLGELLALTPKDFDYANKILNINKNRNILNIVTTPKTPGSIRTILLPEALTIMINEWIEKAMIDKNDFIFGAIAGRTTIKFWLDRYTAMAKLPAIRIHDFRHSHAALLIELNVPPMVIAERLGHESVNTTLSVYAHLYPNKQQVAVQALNTISGF